MREHANIMKSWVLVAALVLALTPAPAYASTTDQILTYIWGELELMNDGLSRDSILYNVSNILSVDLQLFGQMASVATSLGENGNIDVTLDGIWEATTNTYYLVDSITDYVSNLDTNLYSIGQTIGNIDTNLATSTNSLTNIKSNISTISTHASSISSYASSISTKLTTSNTHLNTIKNTVGNFELGIDDISYYTYQTLTRLNEWKNSGYTVNTGLNLTPLLQELVNIETAINSLVNDSTKVFTVNTGLNLTPLLQELVNIDSSINALDDNSYTVNTGLDLSPIVRELTNIETTLETDTIDVNTEWTALDIAGMMLTQNSILDSLDDFYEYQQDHVNSNLSSIFSELQLILGRWDAWRNAGYTVDTGLTIPSLSTVHSKLDSLISAWNTWRNSGYDVDTGLNLNPLLQELVNVESAINGLTFPTFDDSRILLGISSLGESVDAIYNWLLLDSATDVIGDFDFDDLADKSELLLANASNLAPFAGYALIAVMLQIWAGSGVLSEPELNFSFDFFQTGDIVNIDLSWLNDGLPLVHFFMISMLILCLVNSSARIIELEATA